MLSQEDVFAIAHVMISDLAIHRDRSLGDTRTWFSGFLAVKRSKPDGPAEPFAIIKNTRGRQQLGNLRLIH
jgi:hypothetical protein